MDTTRAVGYVRVSVDREDETSTETQEERIRAYCVAHGWQITAVVVEPGRSAYKASRSTRPGFRQAMGLVAAGAADVLVTWKLDRACRDVIDTRNLVNELAKHGAQLVSVTEGFDTTTATGRMTLTVLAALAEMESATRSERVQVWQDKRLAEGSTPTGPRPFGYQRKRNELHIDKVEAKVIRDAAAKILAGDSLRSIVADLGAAGVVSNRGRPITRRGLAAILTGPTIAACRETAPGTFVQSDDWQPILDRSHWDSVRAILTDPARRSGPGNARRWLLSGIACCSRCLDDDDQPVRMQAKPHPSGPRYYCLKCHLSIEVARTDDILERDLLALLDPKAWRRLRRGRPVATADPTGYRDALAQLTARFEAGDIDGAQWASLAEGLRLRQQAASTPPPPLPDVADLRKAWVRFTLEQKRLVIAAATESLLIQPWKPSARFDESRIQWTPVA